MIVLLTLCLAITIHSSEAAMRNLNPRQNMRSGKPNPTIERLAASTSTETIATSTFNAECAHKWLPIFEPCVLSSAEDIADCITNGVSGPTICGSDQYIAPIDLSSNLAEAVVLSGKWMQYTISDENVEQCMLIAFVATPHFVQNANTASIVWSTTEYEPEPCPQYDTQSAARSLLQLVGPTLTVETYTATPNPQEIPYPQYVRVERAISVFYSHMTSSGSLSVYDLFERVYGLRAAQLYFCNNVVSIGYGYDGSFCPAQTVNSVKAVMQKHHENESKYSFDYWTGLSIEVLADNPMFAGSDDLDVQVDARVTLQYVDEVNDCVMTRVQTDTFVFNKDWFESKCSTVEAFHLYTEECAIFDAFHNSKAEETIVCPPSTTI